MGYDLYHRKQPVDVTAARERDDWDTYFKLQDETMCYWRESIWTMERFRSLLVHIGAVDLEAPAGSPDEPTFGLIPIGRLCDNSGWWITPEQCAMVVDKLHAAAEEDPGALIRSYLDGTEQGSSSDLEHGGKIMQALTGARWQNEDATIVVGDNLSGNRDADFFGAAGDIVSIRLFFEGAVDREGIEVW